MNKTVCDHCEETKVPLYDTDNAVIWCQRCMQEDYELMNGVGLEGDQGEALIIKPPFLHEAPFYIAANVAKIKALPKRGAPKVIGVDAGVSVASVQQPAQQFDNAWFERYNSLDALPGRRFDG